MADESSTLRPSEETPEQGGFLGTVQNLLSRKIPFGRIALVLVLVFALLAAGLFSWNRWWRFDDAADLIGTWQVEGQNATLEVDGSYLKLADDAVYTYEMDMLRKTITYRFSDSSGFSSYRFSEDRRSLVLEDNAETSIAVVMHFADDPGFAEGDVPEGIVRLVKVSDEVPSIDPPGSTREKSPLSHGPSSRLSSSSSSSSSSDSALDADAEDSEDDSDEDEDGLRLGPEGTSRGTYDAQGNYTPIEWGYYDETGTWNAGAAPPESYSLLGDGYYDRHGNWVIRVPDASEGSTGGYYDEYGNWVDVAQEQSADAGLADGTDLSGGYTEDGQW